MGPWNWEGQLPFCMEFSLGLMCSQWPPWCNTQPFPPTVPPRPQACGVKVNNPAMRIHLFLCGWVCPLSFFSFYLPLGKCQFPILLRGAWHHLCEFRLSLRKFDFLFWTHLEEKEIRGPAPSYTERERSSDSNAQAHSSCQHVDASGPVVVGNWNGMHLPATSQSRVNVV